MGGILGDAGAGVPPPPKQTPKTLRLGGQVMAAKLTSHPDPVYPPLARQARIQGSVVLHAIISKEGRVEQLNVISGHPLLIQAALDAIRQWRYSPTLLNGDPVEVDTTITVTFTMGN
jgi:protein TonB